MFDLLLTLFRACPPVRVRIHSLQKRESFVDFQKGAFWGLRGGGILGPSLFPRPHKFRGGGRERSIVSCVFMARVYNADSAAQPSLNAALPAELIPVQLSLHTVLLEAPNVCTGWGCQIISWSC